MANALPSLPFPEFPLRPHRNKHWFKSVWDARAQKTRQYYFGSWEDDPKGERALHDPVTGWLARRSAIKAGTDNVRVAPLAQVVSIGELMGRFLISKRSRVAAGELSARTLGDYLFELEKFVRFMKPTTPVDGLRPEHFSAYMHQLVEVRKLGRHARRRVRAYINAMLHYGAKSGWCPMPNSGMDWVAPATDPDSVRQAKLRAGLKDYSDRVVTGEELDKLLDRATPAFKAMILIGVNCGLGPADVGRLRWSMIQMTTGRLEFPRPKTGVMRVVYLWKKTRKALQRVRTLKHNLKALEKEGEASLVFLTRNGRPFYGEKEIHKQVEVDGHKVTKLTGVAVENSISGTFRRMAKDLELAGGMHFYRLRHSTRTYAKKARDKEAIDLIMGHKDRSAGRVYDHGQVEWHRIKRVAKVVYRRLWPKLKPKEGTKPQTAPTGPVAEAAKTAEAS